MTYESRCALVERGQRDSTDDASCSGGEWWQGSSKKQRSKKAFSSEPSAEPSRTQLCGCWRCSPILTRHDSVKSNVNCY